ncbi:unnamed protein product [Adineta steineri]|uniref:Uncharacterized protein n=1 Tax=Adineta steineri TaxID=433720 RepID=A0A813P5Q5_9BILA|nr:unnamed protein product [Adineta steineri]CAF0973986.1 unnamed protein product [Adineta steineri]CAF1057971.1 unnamed protein product [Adineta steineri]
MQFQSTLIRIILFLTIQNALAVDDIFSDEKLDFPDTCETGHVTGDWKECASRLSTLIWDAHTWYDNQPISICKIKCTRVLKGHVSKFKWVWDAKFHCEEKAPGIIGKARGFKTRREAMQSAISQTIEQAIMNDKLTANDFKCLFT